MEDDDAHLHSTDSESSWLSATHRFYIVVFISFFAKGILETMPSLSVSFYYKDTLKLSPTETSALGSMMTIPWTMKPIYGFMSDNFPIFGYRRKSYVLLAGCCVTTCYILLALGNHTTLTFVALQLVATFFMAVSNVVAEALTVERRRRSPSPQPAVPSALADPCLSIECFAGVMRCALTHARARSSSCSHILLNSRFCFSRGLSQTEAAKYQSLVWGTNSLANCIGSFFGGYVLKCERAVRARASAISEQCG
jgi:hypothetical protein